MILPIVAYGAKVLKMKAQEVVLDDPELPGFIENLWETMYAASGVGLAAPQVGRSLRLFIIDASPFADDENLGPEEQKLLKSFKKVFINPEIESETGDLWGFNEGCLSIPNIREDVDRKDTITLSYTDEKKRPQKETYTGLAARVIQHEFDHINGVLFTDRLSSLKKRLLKGKLTQIARGKVDADYVMRFPNDLRL
ncbi:MAG: peptide deformylase [Flavobacteriaceae bacterium]